MYPKKIICALMLYIGTSATVFSINDKDSLGLPGDNLDLYGVLDLFKKSSNPEDFEKALNTQNNSVNNLDLNGDGYIDYIKVIDHSEKYTHALVLQVAVNENENQDVAVVEIEKNKDGTAHIQVIGDEALYGKNYIVEPADNEMAAPASPPAPSTTVYVKPAPVIMVDVWGWPSVRYMYEPHYVTWVSPWRWSYYPVWFAPWRPLGWGIYYGNVYHYHYYHHRVFENHITYANHIYYGHRSFSPTVYQRRGITGSPATPVNHPRGTPQQPVNHARSASAQQHPVDRNFQRRSAPAPGQNNSGARSTAPRINSAPRATSSPRGNSAPRANQEMHSAPRSSAIHSQGGGHSSGGHSSGGHSGGGHSGGGHSGGGHGGRR